MKETDKENSVDWRAAEWYKPRNFILLRKADMTGVSGTGIVAVGSVMPTGYVALTWLSEHSSWVWYESIEKVAAIHTHHGASEIVWIESDKYQELFKV
jgi:hypothetical protein